MKASHLAGSAAVTGGILGGGAVVLAGFLSGHGSDSWVLLGAPAAAAAGAGLAARLAVGVRLGRPLDRLLDRLLAPESPAPGAPGGREGGTGEVRSVAAALRRLRVEQTADRERADLERTRLLQLLEGMPLGVLSLDPRGRILFANRAARETLGITRNPEGRTPIEVVRSGEIQSAVDAALESPEPRTLECTLTGPARRHITVQIFPVQSGPVVVVQDVTRIRHLEEARRDMVANIGHELRTPLSAILGYLETLEHSPDLPPEEQARFLSIIGRNSRRLERLVQDLSRLSRLESAAISPAREVLDLHAASRTALETIQPRAEVKSISVDSDIVRDLPRLWVDRDALQTVLLNLLDNAVRATPPGGAVRLGARPEGARIRIWVEDTGPGVPRDFRERVFERFYRLDFGRAAGEGGTGLGLAIVKHAVQQHGGDVGIEEGPGGGARFWFTLPAAPGEDSALVS